jgi:hypothetical protein
MMTWTDMWYLLGIPVNEKKKKNSDWVELKVPKIKEKTISAGQKIKFKAFKKPIKKFKSHNQYFQYLPPKKEQKIEYCNINFIWTYILTHSQFTICVQWICIFFLLFYKPKQYSHRHMFSFTSSVVNSRWSFHMPICRNTQNRGDQKNHQLSVWWN